MERMSSDSGGEAVKTETVAELAGFGGYGSVTEAARTLGVSPRTIYRLKAGEGSAALRARAEQLARDRARKEAEARFESPAALGVMVDRIHSYLLEHPVSSHRLAGELDIIIDLATAMARGEDPRRLLVDHIDELDGYVRELIAQQQ